MTESLYTEQAGKSRGWELAVQCAGERYGRLYTSYRAWNGHKDLYGEHAHQSANHKLGQSVRGGCTPNLMKNYWSGLKRTVKRPYIHVSGPHLHRYLGEQEFRLNHRK
jgi:hypothetical protein